MQIQIQKWGNSLGFRIPSSFARETKIDSGSMVDLGVKEGRLIITPLKTKKISLESLLMEVKSANIPKEEDFGARQGLEAW